MKKSILALGMILLTSMGASAADECAKKVIMAVHKKAQAYRPDSDINAYGFPDVVSETQQGRRLITVWELGVEHCSPKDPEQCGSLTYEAVTAGAGEECKVLRVDLIGEE